MSEIKQPEDHQSPSTDHYDWTAPDGRVVTLKSFKRLPAGIFRKAKDMNEMDSTFAVIEAAVDADGLAIVDELELGQLEKLFNDWAAAAGVDSPQS